MNFDTILHLSCEHAVPVYRSASQLQAARHIVAVAQEHASFYQNLQQCLPEDIHLEKVNVKTSDPDGYTRRVIKVIEGLPPGKHALHLFGASRSVFTILWAYCQDNDIPCFFPDNESMAYRWANAGDMQVQAFEPVIRTVSDFFQLSGYRLDEQRATDAWDQSIRNQAAALAVQEEQSRIKAFSQHVREFSKKPGKPFRINSQNVKGMTMAATLKQPKDGNQGRLILGEQKFVIRPWANMAAFLCGDWYRDALLKRIIEVKGSLGIVDIKTDCEITHEHPLSDMPTRYHIDIAYTDGKTLGLIQTLRRSPEIHHVRNLRKTLHGLAHNSGRGVLCSLDDASDLKEAIACWPDTSIASGIESVLQEL